MMAASLLRKFITDKEGKIAVWQTPNLPLWSWLVLTILAHVVPSAHGKSVLGYLATSFLFVWAYLELRSGLSYFRRSVGLIVLLGIVMNHLR
jgi:hypothetical protein